MIHQNETDYISLTDMTATFKEGSGLIGKWITNKNTLEYLGVWEKINNPDFNYPEFGVIGQESGIKLEWSLQRTLAKVNYYIHTDAIKSNLIPKEITKQQASFVYANEADLLNVALFGIAAKEWRDSNPDKSGNIRDYATLEQLIVLSNLESINALLIGQNSPQNERLIQLNKVAIVQMKSLTESNTLKKLK